MSNGWNFIGQSTRDAFVRSSHARTFQLIRPERAGNVGGNPITAGSSYVSLSVARMRLKYGGVLWKDFYPMVHSFVELAREGANEVTVPFVSSSLFEDQRDTGRIIAQNFDLLRPTPYIGGNLNVAVGLFAAEERDYLKNLVDVLGSLSGLIGGTTISGALNILNPLKSGAEALLGMSDGLQMKIGIVNSFRPDAAPLRPGAFDEHQLVDGLYALVNVAEKENYGPWLSFENGVLTVEYKGGRHQEVDQDYLVLRIAQSDEMTEWARIPGLYEARKSILATVINDGMENDSYRKAWASFKSSLVQNADLLKTDRARIILSLQAEAESYAAKPPVGIHGEADEDTVLQNMLKNGPAVEEAKDISLESL
jgi:hypothetical protein